MPYPGDTIDTTHFVNVTRVVNVTNDLIQIVHVETCEWGYLIQRVCIKPDRKMINLFYNTAD